MRAMVWVVMLIVVVTFMFSMCFVQSSEGLLEPDHPPGHPSGNRWKNMLVSMLNLVSVATGGEDWIMAYASLESRGQGYGFLFVVYILFFHFVVQNTVTSVFVEAVFQDRADNELLIMEER